MMEDDRPDRFDTVLGAEKLALHLVIQALVDHASTTAPDLRDRITQAVEAYIATLDPQSELERDFAERARASVAVLLRPPAA